ncbi:MAG TPA: anti-sigma factor [Gaiellaceae bacterium]|jgi:hypothetical protein
MSNVPDLDALLPDDVPSGERERLRRAHEALLAAGPPPELSPELAAGPDMVATYGRRPHRTRNRAMMLLAAALALVVAFVLGYLSHGTGSEKTQALIPMRGTAAAKGALASITLRPVEEGGNWPMEVKVSGLPELPSGSYYELFLTKHGKVVASCGAFRVHEGVTTVTLNAPYRLRSFTGWVVTRQDRMDRMPGPVLMRTSQT